MKYESAILKRLIDTYGVVGNPRYISEIIKEFIIQGKECYPDLFTYQSDWLAHIDEFGLNPSYTVSYTGQSIYAPNTLEKPVKSAILSGSTKYRDIDTGEFLETFEEDRNLELVSVKMPVLSTTGKNLLDINKLADINNHTATLTTATYTIAYPLQLKPNTTYSISRETSDKLSVNLSVIAIIDGSENRVSITGTANQSRIATTGNDGVLYLAVQNVNESNLATVINDVGYLQVEEASVATSYEPFKSNILTTPSDLTLRGIGDVQDTLDCLTGELIENTGIYTLTGDESFSFIERTDNFTSYGFVLPDYKKPKGGNSVDFICNLFKGGYAWGSNNAECIGYGALWSKIVIRIEKSKLSTDTINGFSEFVRNNTITVVYPKTESIKTVDLTILDQNGQNVKQLMSFNGGTHFNTGSSVGSLLPSLTVDVVTNLEETLKVCSLEGNTM